MLPLLSREEINNLVNLTINEKAVSWNDSFLKGLGSGVAKSFSFLGDKIKGGLEKSKMNSYVMQWGAEYAKAIDAYKKENENVLDDNQDESEDIIDSQDKKEIDDKFIKSFNFIYSLVNGLNKQGSEFRKHFSNKTMINLSSLKESLDKILDSINFDDDVFNSYFKDITELYEADDNVINAFNDLIFIIRTINEDIREDSDLYQRLQKELDLEKFVPNESKWPELKQSMSKAVLNTLGVLSKYLEPIKKDIDNKVNDNYTFINETFELPTEIEDLYDKEELEKLSKIKDIKLLTFKKINTKSMSVIEYEAKYTINKSDKNKSELKRIWDIGKKNVENYFQDVVDTKKVNDEVKNDEVPADVKTQIDNQNVVVDMAGKMGLTPLDPIKTTFKDKQFYAFNMTAIGSAGTLSDAYFVVSPTSQFIEEDSEGNKFYYFNIFGQYKYNDKTKTIERLNFFDDLSKNAKMDKNFKNKQNSYYMVMPMMKVNTGIKQDRLFYIYSNSGKGFYNKEIIDDYSTILDKIKQSNKATWVKIGNAFKYSVNGRFSIDMENIKRFPGLDNKDLTNESGIQLAKKNHKILIDNLKDK